jgi:hypothetical protein
VTLVPPFVRKIKFVHVNIFDPSLEYFGIWVETPTFQSWIHHSLQFSLKRCFASVTNVLGNPHFN